MRYSDDLDALIESAYERKAFPGAVCVVGRGNDIYYKKLIGYSRWFSDDDPCLDVIPSAEKGMIPVTWDTMWDLASCSKLVSTTMIALRFLEKGIITMRDTIGMYYPDAPEDKRYITISQLMTHTSGFSAYFHLFEIEGDSSKAAEKILNHPLEYETGTKCIYSCMGFILLAKILEKISGKTIDLLADEYVFGPLDMSRTCYNPLKHGYSPDEIAATEYNADMGRYICGVVHDENARSLDGLSGNAGVFSCAGDMVKFASMLSRRGEGFLSHACFEAAVTNRTPGMMDGDMNRGWGFQLLGENEFSAMSDLYSVGSYGHNGFTGPSLYVDNRTGIYTLFLCNRVHFTRQSDRIFRFRRQLHNTVMASFDR
ncbi:MAG: beta-lactamase family protein [Clostridia bacterium]|nr:beta-lactamase family protein [Clostridia bacterium]